MRPECPDVESLAVYLEHKLSAEEVARLESHFVRCRKCREIIASVIKSESEVPDPIIPGQRTTAIQTKHLYLFNPPHKK